MQEFNPTNFPLPLGLNFTQDDETISAHDLDPKFRGEAGSLIYDDGPYIILCLSGGLRRRLQSRTDASGSGASSFAL